MLSTDAHIRVLLKRLKVFSLISTIKVLLSGQTTRSGVSKTFNKFWSKY